MITIVNYGMGNLNSVKRKFDQIGVKALISDISDEILNADKIILPGVGHFAKAVSNLKNSNLWDTLNKAVIVNKIPILGICLGLQLMTRHSEEGNVNGFGWFDAEVVHFEVKDKLKHKIPHMGWNNANAQKNSKLFENLPMNPEFYFVHSYHIKANNQQEVLATTNYEYNFVSALEIDNIFGVQFHPEKSHDVGESLLANFVKI